MKSEHHAELTQIISLLPTSCLSSHDLEVSAACAARPHQPLSFQRTVERFAFLLDQYQERRQLLDAHIRDYIAALLAHVDITHAQGRVTPRADAACQLLAHVCKVRGEKTMLMRMPHQVEYVNAVLRTVERVVSLKQTTDVRSIHDVVVNTEHAVDDDGMCSRVRARTRTISGVHVFMAV